MGLVIGLGLGIVIGRDYGTTGSIVGALLGATVGPVIVRLPRLRREFVTIFDWLEALGLMFGLAMGVAVARASRSGWLAGIGFALLGACIGWVVGWLPAVLREWYRRRGLSKATTDALRTRLRDREIDMWLPYNLVIHELQRRGEDIRSELPFVVRLLSDDGSEERHHGWQILQVFFPDLAQEIADYDPSLGKATCQAKAASIAP